MWPVLTALAVGVAIALHLWWRSKYRRANEVAERRMEELRQTQERGLLEIQTRQEAVFDSMAEGLLLVNQGGRIQLANRAFNEIFGVTGELRSRTILEAVRMHELAELVEYVATEKQVLGYELKLSRPTERWLQVNAAAIYAGGAERYGTILVFHDVTRIKQLERTRQEFVANVSHELRTPLSLIKGYVETLLEGASANPEVATKFLQTIDRNAERLKLLIEDLLTISELESGRVLLQLQAVPLRSLVEKVLTDLKARATLRQMALLNNVPELTVRADTGRLEQVLCNLVDNAVKYGRKAGTVTVAARQVDHQVEVSVQDDGPGIPAKELERLFERFYRVDKARSREQGGTGLGLSIVKHIIQSHGGKVWAKSELGHGATFFFTLQQTGES